MRNWVVKSGLRVGGSFGTIVSTPHATASGCTNLPTRDAFFFPFWGGRGRRGEGIQRIREMLFRCGGGIGFEYLKLTR